MKLTLIAASTLMVIAVTGLQSGASDKTLTEYDAVSGDGPYSYLPTPGYGSTSDDIAGQSNLSANPEIVTAEEARMTALLLDILAGDPLSATIEQAPLDRPVLSDTEIVLAGL